LIEKAEKRVRERWEEYSKEIKEIKDTLNEMKRRIGHCILGEEEGEESI